MKPSVFVKRKYLLTEVLTAVLILVTVAGCIFYGKTSYSKMVSEVDESLSKRIEKYDLYQKGYSSAILTDPDNMDTSHVMDYIYFLENDKGFASVSPYEMYYVCVSGDETNTSYELLTDKEPWIYSSTMIKSVPAMIWKDADGDLVSMVNGRMAIFPAGYGYSVYSGSEYEGEQYVTGLNQRSNSNKDMVTLANELFTKEEKKGWEGQYRYLIANKDHKDGYGKNYLFFTDCSELKADWKKNIAIISVGAVLLDVLLIVTMFLLEWRKNKQIVPGAKTEFSPDPSAETEKSEKPGTSSEIPKDIAKQILSYVDDAERSTGPSGYLDSIRSTIEENIEKK